MVEAREHLPIERPLPGRYRSSELLERLAGETELMVLDSGGGPPLGRTTIIAIGARTRIRWCVESAGEGEDPFERLRALLATTRGPDTNEGRWPFVGGYLGWIGYGARQILERLPERHAPLADPHPADVLIREARLLVLLEEATGRASLVRSVPREGQASRALADAAERVWKCLVAPRRGPPEGPAAVAARRRSAGPRRADAGPREAVRLAAPGLHRPDPEEHLAAIDATRAAIGRGDVYQANIGRRFHLPAPADPFAAYLRLRAANPATYGAYATDGEAVLMSVSPERFVSVRAGEASTRPIKGTARRVPDPEGDRAAAEGLLASEKDRAELAMIVDVLRNDLAAVCEVGSIQVPAPIELETHPTVHHLVAEVRGQLVEGKGAVDLLRAAFPGGSITGAPRIRAMEIIDQLERFRRGPWCGSFAYFGDDGAMDTSILIRSAWTEGEQLVFAGGGGITWSSEREAELAETEDKVAGLAAGLADPSEPASSPAGSPSS